MPRSSRSGTTSITVKVESWVRRGIGEEQIAVTEGIFTYVAVGDDRRPTPGSARNLTCDLHRYRVSIGHSANQWCYQSGTLIRCAPIDPLHGAGPR